MTSPETVTITLDADSKQPLFEQICAWVRSASADGTLAPGTRMPTTRALAAHLGIAVNTVAKAYRVLEIEGVIVGRGRQGTFVVDQQGTAPEREALHFVRMMQTLGVDHATSLSLVTRAWKETQR